MSSPGFTLVAAVGNGGGLAFGGRRLSRDRALRARLLELCAGHTLRMSAYSLRQFTSAELDGADVRVSEDFLSLAQPGDFCFIENTDALPFAGKCARVALFRWNRDYPFDLALSPALLEGFSLESSGEFAGFSHERITLEVYSR